MGNLLEIISSTLGKALGGANGGFITGKQEVIDTLRQKGRPYLFSNSLPTMVVAAYIQSFKILEENPDLIPTLHRNVQLFRTNMKRLGFEILGNNESAIVPGMYLSDSIENISIYSKRSNP